MTTPRFANRPSSSLPPSLATGTGGGPRSIALVACGMLLCLPALAADVYRWVDENGRVHFSDSVPEKYKKSGKKIDVQPHEPSEEQRKEAEARAARDKEKAAESASNAQSKPNPPPAGAAKPRPPAPSNDASDCATLHRRYRESIDCFAPYVTANGSVKAEAYAKCASVPDPSSKCGPPK